MIVIAQPQETQVSNDSYELFEIIPMEDENGVTVNVKKSLGYFTLAQLEQQKASYQTYIDSIQEKIDAINNL